MGCSAGILLLGETPRHPLLIGVMMEEEALPPEEPATKVAKRIEMDQYIAMAMSGLLPRSRELNYWEPKLLDERHLRAVMMRATGLQQGFIAREMGWTDAWTSVVLNHPDAVYILQKVVSYAADSVLDIQTRVKGHAGEMLDRILEITRTTADQRLASQNAFEILKMAGYGAVEKKQVEHSVHIPTQKLDLLQAALEESNSIRSVEGVDYRMVPGPTDSEAPVVPENSGSVGAVLPPDSEVQEPIREVA